MSDVKIIDTTLRDGQQSLWACRMRAGAMLPALQDIDAAGYDGVEFSVPTAQFARAVRDLKENPWDWLVEGTAVARNSELRLHGSMDSKLSEVPLSVQELFLTRLVELGITTTRTSDPWNDFEQLSTSVETMARHGIATVVNLIYTTSPRHDLAYYERKMRELVKQNPHRICLKDVGGLMTPEVAHELIPMIVDLAADVPVEFHAHCNSGLAPYVTVLAAELGIEILHSAIPPLANGTSQPSVFSLVQNLRERGFEVDLDVEPLKRASDHLWDVARRESLPVGSATDFDARLYRHQVPGGMISNLHFQLQQLKQTARLDEVLDEVARVREDFGYPIMVTPLSQFVGTQAVINVVTGRRYATVTDETIRYALGRFGPEAVEVMDPETKALVLNRARADELQDLPEVEPDLDQSLDDVRASLDRADLSDDDLIVYYFLGSSASSTPIPPRADPPRTYAEYAARNGSVVDIVRAAHDAEIRSVFVSDGTRPRLGPPRRAVAEAGT